MGIFKIFTILAVLIVTVFNAGTTALPSGTPSNNHISERVIHLKHGRLHLADDESEVNKDGHIRYKWFEDDYDDLDDEDDDDMENMVELSGGCELTKEQFIELETFLNQTHYVNKCYCEQGGVYCLLCQNFRRDNKTCGIK